MHNLYLVLFLLFTSVVYAQEITDDSTAYSVSLENITIEENRLSTPFSDLARSVSVVTREEIMNSPAQSVAEVLSFTAGVDVRQRGPIGTQADISIRGGTFDQSLVLVNGVKMNDPQTGHHMMNLPVQLQNIERIEVIRGQAARLYGQNAFSGAINIVTKIPKQSEVSVGGYAGSYGSRGAFAQGALRTGENLGQSFTYSHDEANSYREDQRNDFVTNAYNYQARLNALNGEFSVLAGITDRKFGANGFYVEDTGFPDEYEEVQTGFVALTYDTDLGNWHLKPRVYWRNNQDYYVYVRDQPEIFTNDHTTNVMGYELQTSYRGALGLTGIGAEVRTEAINSTNLGERERNILGLYAEHRFYLFNRLDITPGIFVNYYNDFGWNFFPGIDLSFAVNKALSLYANAGRSVRIPTYTDLYYNGPSNIGNPDLQPEQAFSMEAGARYLSDNLMIQGGYFRRTSDNLIDWTRRPGEENFQPNNFYNARIEGMEAGITLNPGFTVSNRRFIQQAALNYVYTGFSLGDTKNVESRYAIDNLKHQLIGKVTHKVFGPVYHNLRYRYLDRATADNYHVVDTRVFYKKNKLNIYLEATNLFDVTYIESGFAVMPGRWIRGGFRFTIK